ncbi:MAG: hypothetical protein GX262_13480 [Clostridia bacterium]|nr:hypothetical protein [Clostridia bacterium]
MRKSGKNPTRRQKEIIAAKRLNPQNWLVMKAPPGELHIVHRHTSATRVIREVS